MGLTVGELNRLSPEEQADYWGRGVSGCRKDKKDDGPICCCDSCQESRRDTMRRIWVNEVFDGDWSDYREEIELGSGSLSYRKNLYGSPYGE